MDLEFKKDFPTVQKRWEQFWKTGLKDPILSIIVPKDGVEVKPAPPYLSGIYGDYRETVERVLRWAETHEFMGDAIPFHNVEFGANHFSALLGADLEYLKNESESTTWCKPFVKDWDDVKLSFSKNTRWWEKIVDTMHCLKDKLDGKIMLAPPAFAGGLDCLASIRGNEQFLMDLYDCPDKIHRALAQVDKAFREAWEAIRQEFEFDKYGCISRHGMYSTESVGAPQCDCSCMISKEMLDEFELRALKNEMEVLKNASYHLDGPGAIHHLESICTIDSIKVIEWVPGAGNESSDWNWLYDKIDSLGKGHQEKKEIHNIFHNRSYNSNRIMYYVLGLKSEDEGKRVLEHFGR